MKVKKRKKVKKTFKKVEVKVIKAEVEGTK